MITAIALAQIIWTSPVIQQHAHPSLDVIQTFGAQCDGVTDDYLALNAAIGTAIAVGVPLYLPPINAKGQPSRCGTSQPLIARGPLTTVGDGAPAHRGVIMALAPMSSVMTLQTNYVATGDQNGAVPEFASAGKGKIADLAVDAANIADNAIVMNVTQYTDLDNIFVENAKYAGVRMANTQVPVKIGAVTSTGGASASDIDVSLADPFYSSVHLNNLTTWVLKITQGGALGTATYQLSIDGGASFSGTNITTSSVSNLATMSGTNVGTISGFQVAFHPVTYFLNATYTIPLTWTTAVYGDIGSPNGDLTAENIQIYSCGSTFWTTGLAGNFSGSGYRGGMTPGTASTTAGNGIIVGSGTQWAHLYGTGYTRALMLVGSLNGTLYEGAVIDDTHFATFSGLTPTATVTGADFAIAVGGGWYEDGLEEGGWASIVASRFGRNSTCLNFGHGSGPYTSSINLISCALAGGVFGGNSADSASGAVALHWHGNSGTEINGAVAYFLGPFSSGSIIEPVSLDDIGGKRGGGQWTRIKRGVIDHP